MHKSRPRLVLAQTCLSKLRTLSSSAGASVETSSWLQGKVSAVEAHRGEHGVEWHGAGAAGGTFRVQLQSPANLYGELAVRSLLMHLACVSAAHMHTFSVFAF